MNSISKLETGEGSRFSNRRGWILDSVIARKHVVRPRSIDGSFRISFETRLLHHPARLTVLPAR